MERAGRGIIIDRGCIADGVDTMKIRNLHLNDLDMLQALFKKHLFYMKQDRSVDRSSSPKIAKRLYFSYILNVPLSFLGLDTFVGLVAQTDDGDIMGTIAARRFPLGKSWVIGPVVCHADFRNLGITTHMMNLVIKHLREKKAKSVIVSVERNNILATRFFKKFGFRYLKPIFRNHGRARNYVRAIVLIHGYLRSPSYKIEQYPPPRARENFNLPGIRKTKMWCIMLKEFDRIPRAYSTM